jgi:hypothetical protein
LKNEQEGERRRVEEGRSRKGSGAEWRRDGVRRDK